MFPGRPPAPAAPGRSLRYALRPPLPLSLSLSLSCEPGGLQIHYSGQRQRRHHPTASTPRRPPSECVIIRTAASFPPRALCGRRYARSNSLQKPQQISQNKPGMRKQRSFFIRERERERERRLQQLAGCGSSQAAVAFCSLFAHVLLTFWGQVGGPGAQLLRRCSAPVSHQGASPIKLPDSVRIAK